jgi:hypothetical protein
MATVYKTLLNDDVVSTRTLLHESIPITGTIVSGTYDDDNIKNYSHGRFQSVYDYPYLSSSANHIFDLSVGFAPNSSLSGATAGHLEVNKKIQMYNQMAQVLVGHDTTGSILPFDEDGDLLAGGTKLKECVFLSFSRLLVKDEIKKASVQLVIGTGSYSTPFAGTKTITDYGANNEYRVNSPAGEYGIMYSGSGTGPCGLVYYQAGLMVLTASVFGGGSQFLLSGSTDQNVEQALTGSSIQDFADAVRSRVKDIDFNNTVELNSTVYFCRINHNEFNYSSNPTYLSESKIRVKDTSVDSPASYITTVGLYSADNELLATAKLSEPLKKTPENEMILRVRLDY